MERHAFPAVFRAGHTFEGPVARAWLNKWIPFDFSSRAPHKYWESCGSSWEPIADDNRIIFRSLDAEFPWWSNGTEIDKAFYPGRGCRAGHVLRPLGVDGPELFREFPAGKNKFMRPHQSAQMPDRAHPGHSPFQRRLVQQVSL